MVRAPYRAVKNRVAGFGKYEKPYLFRFQVPRAGAALGFPACPPPSNPFARFLILARHLSFSSLPFVR